MRYLVACSKNSQRWLKEHFDDPCVEMAQKDGYRSLASCKLLEIQSKDRILCPGTTVVDLGAATGGWSQVASRVLRQGNDFLIKQGEGSDAYHEQVRALFDKVQMHKPLSSRDRACEQYLLARGFRGA